MRLNYYAIFIFFVVFPNKYLFANARDAFHSKKLAIMIGT